MKRFILALTVCLLAGASHAMAEACLNGAVTQGTITLTCTLIDNTGTVGASDSSYVGANFLLQTRAVSSNSATSAVVFTLTWQFQPPGDPKLNPAQVNTLTGVSVPSATGDFRYTFNYGGGLPSAPTITSITVQELVPTANSQTFQ